MFPAGINLLVASVMDILRVRSPWLTSMGGGSLRLPPTYPQKEIDSTVTYCIVGYRNRIVLFFTLKYYISHCENKHMNLSILKILKLFVKGHFCYSLVFHFGMVRNPSNSRLQTVSDRNIPTYNFWIHQYFLLRNVEIATYIS